MNDTSEDYEPFRALFVDVTNALKPHIYGGGTEYMESIRRGSVHGRMIDGRSVCVAIVTVDSTKSESERSGKWRNWTPTQ
jgi:hypothetical protein